mgnify:CR=1 FL=1
MKLKNSTTLEYLFVILIICSFLSANMIHLGSYTSILNPHSVIIDSGRALMPTSGGVSVFNLNSRVFNTINNDNGLELSNIKSLIIDSRGRMILGGQDPAIIQVYSSYYGLVDYIDGFEADEFYVLKECSDKIFSASYDSNKGYSVYEFRYDLDQDRYYYYDLYDHFEGKIISIDCIDSYIYVSTSEHIYRSLINDNYLGQSSSWDIEYNGDLLGVIINNNSKYAINSEKIYNLGTNQTEYDIQIDTLISSKEYDDGLYLLGRSSISGYNDNGLFFSYDIDTTKEFTGFEFVGDTIYASIKNNGISSIDINSRSMMIYSPNTLLTNRYNAIDISSNRDLIGISNIGGFILTKFNSLKNFLPTYRDDLPMDDSESNKFWAKVMTYSMGRDVPWSIVSNDQEFFFSNRSVYPRNKNTMGGIIQISKNLENKTCWDTTNAVIDGLSGIYNPSWDDGLMVVNQLKFDGSGNLWALNPYSENYGYVAGILSENKEWSHIFSESFLPSIPIEMDFDNYGNVWICFESQTKMESLETYSVGGIKIVDYNSTINDSYDDIWYDINNPDILPGGKGESIWSIAIDHMGILWALSSYGVQGYFIDRSPDGYELVSIYPYPFYGNIPFYKGDRIRVDSQNNKWITTQHSGVFVISRDLSPWPDQDGINVSNSELLSNVVYDIAFDDTFGIVYISTSGGISFFDIPFSSTITNDSLSISPNPYSISSESGLSISGSGNNGIILIADMNGNVVRRFELDSNISKVVGWDGSDTKGNQLSTGIYIISSFSSDTGVKYGKVALIK